jgi:N-glycosylase/DNA lyase
MPSLSLAHSLDLQATLLGGQTFCWTEHGRGVFSGWIEGVPIQLQVRDRFLHWNHPAVSPQSIERYFCLDLDWSKTLGEGGKDPWLVKASQAHPGLRPVRDEPWECLVNFLCSSLKQIAQIQQINARLRTAFGGAKKVFPSPEILAEAGEKALRGCALGYRARHVAQTSEIIARSPAWLAIRSSLSTSLAAQHLEQLPGVGPKISRCVLLYAYSRWDAFPVDVWVDRLVRELYFPRRRKPFRFDELETWSHRQFGAGRGLAQLRLFHWFRTRPDARLSKTTKH